jgi:hypothetical protein
MLAPTMLFYFFGFHTPPQDPACPAANSALSNTGTITVGDQRRLNDDADNPAAEHNDIISYLNNI